MFWFWFPIILSFPLGWLTDPLTGGLLSVIITVALYIIFYLPLLSAIVIGAFTLFSLYEYSTMSEDITNLLQEKNTITIGEFLKEKGYGVSDYDDCILPINITCLTYRKVKKMSESGEITLTNSYPLTVNTVINSTKYYTETYIEPLKPDFDMLMEFYKDNYGFIFAAYDQWVAEGITTNKNFWNWGKEFCENKLSEKHNGILQYYSTYLKIDADPCNVNEFNLQVYRAISPTSSRYTSADWKDYENNAKVATEIYQNLAKSQYSNPYGFITHYEKKLEDINSGRSSGARGEDLGLPLLSFVSLVFAELDIILSGKEEDWDLSTLNRQVTRLSRISELALYSQISSEKDIKNRIKNWGITPTIFNFYADLVEDSPRKQKVDAVYQKFLKSGKTSIDTETQGNLNKYKNSADNPYNLCKEYNLCD